MAAEMIKFLKGTRVKYNELKAAGQLTQGTLYFCTDGALYLYDTLIAEINVTDEGSVDALIQAALAPYYTSVQIDTILADYLKTADLDLSNYYTKSEADKIHSDAEEATTKAIAEALEEAKKYADDNDTNDNTTYTISYESKVEGEGGHPARIVLTPSEGNAQYVDATPFIKDGMINTIVIDENDNLVITFNTDAGKDEISIPLTDFIDVYVGSNGDAVNVSVSGNTISADLTQTVKDDIAKGVEAHGWGNHANVGYLTAHQDISGKADKVANAVEGNFAGLDANGNLTDSGKKASDFVSSENYVAYSQDEKDKLAKIEAGAEVNQVIATGSTNGAISVDGVDVAVYGLGSAAYTNSNQYDAAGAAAAVQGNTSETVESVVKALNIMNNKVVDNSAETVALTSDVKNVVDMLTWGTF